MRVAVPLWLLLYGGSLPAPPPPPPAVVLPVGAEHVRWCESRDDYGAHNPHSTASGGWQFTDGTWTATTGLPAPAAAHPRHVQDAAFVDLWDGGAGAGHWDASRTCWAPRMRTAGLDVPPWRP